LQQLITNLLSGDVLFLTTGNVLFLLIIYRQYSFMKGSRSEGVVFKSIDYRKQRNYLILTALWTALYVLYPLVASYYDFHIHYPVLYYVLLAVFLGGLLVLLTSNKAFYIKDEYICYVWPAFDRFDEETYLAAIRPKKNGMNQLVLKNLLRHTTEERMTKKLLVHQKDLKRFRRRFPEAEDLFGEMEGTGEENGAYENTGEGIRHHES